MSIVPNYFLPMAWIAAQISGDVKETINDLPFTNEENEDDEMAMVCVNGARECTGCMTCQERQDPVCPECNKPCDTYYFNVYGSIIGCDQCIRAEDAWPVEVEA